jgi:tetraacyldisaccharide 4'-kinase
MHSNWHHLFDCLQGRGDAAVASRCSLNAVAGAAAAVYGLGARLRRGLYAHGIFRAKRLPAPVLSIGNLTVGGTGKTPLTACLARFFQAQAQRVAILSRGYGGTAKGVTKLSDGKTIFAKPPLVGEEAYWLARALPGAAVYTGSCRYAAGLAAWREFKPDLFLLDDGLQHFQLHRDLDVVLLDAAAPFGNGQLLPRGPLREPQSALTAAQVLILTRYRAETHQAVRDALQRAYPGKTVLTADLVPVAVRRFPPGSAEPPEVLNGLTLYAFAGLARPQVFFSTLVDLGVTLTGRHAFPDHYALTPKDLELLIQEARAGGAQALITTAKDWARLGESWDAALPLWVLDVEARLHQPLPEALLRRIGGPG